MGSEVKTMTSSKMLMIFLFTFLSLIAITHGESRTIKGKRCIFPFTYKGVTYKTCAKADSELAWCATEVHPSGKVVNNKWEDCDEVVETDLSSIFGPGHEGVVQTAVFRPRQNQTSVDVPAHGQNMALGIVIQGLGGRDQVTAPYLLTITEQKCFLNNLPGEFEPSGILKSPSSHSGIVKKHIIQTNSRKVIEGTSQYNELSFAIKSKCRGKGIFKATYKLLSSQEYSESKNFYNFSTISSSRKRRFTPSPIPNPCTMSREYKCARTGGPGCFYWRASDGTQTHIYDGEEEYCLCCTNFCPPEHNPTYGENCECDQITTKDDFLAATRVLGTAIHQKNNAANPRFLARFLIFLARFLLFLLTKGQWRPVLRQVEPQLTSPASSRSSTEEWCITSAPGWTLLHTPTTRPGVPPRWTVEDIMLEDRGSGATVDLPVRYRIEFYFSK